MGSTLSNLLARFASRRLRRFPASLCFVALAVQLLLPVLHVPHDLGSGEAALEAASPASLHTDGCRDAPAAARHDAATCSHCRLVSQLRALSPLVTLTAAPAVRAAWIALAAGPIAPSRNFATNGPPRAPPFSA